MSPPVREITLRANGLEFPALTAGEGPLLLCLHGFPDDPWSFEPQLAALPASGWQVVAPTLRGYDPRCLRGPYQPAVAARDVLALADALGAPTFSLYGHDWGAPVAYMTALLAPSRVRRLVGAAVPYGPGLPMALISNPEQQRRSWYLFFFQTRLAEVALPLGGFAFLDRLLRDWSPDHAPDPAWLARVREQLALPGVLEGALGYYRASFDPTLRDPDLSADENRLNLDPIEVPTLYVHGARDGCIGAEVSEGSEALFPAGYRRVVLAGAGHFVHREDPAGFHGALLAHLRA